MGALVERQSPTDLKDEAGNAEILMVMTASTTTVPVWASHPLAKATRIAIAVGGMAAATLVLTVAAIVTSGSWGFVALGTALAACSVRAARLPSAGRLLALAACVVAVPIALQLL